MNATWEAIALPKLEEGYQLMHICDVSWEAYELIGEAFLNRRNIRLNYLRGNLEIMTLSPEHERLRLLLGLLVDIMAVELNIAYIPFGSSTYKQQEAEHGVEPDQCYYLSNLELVRPIMRLDLQRDPVPDFAIEIDVTHSSIDRMGIYARLGIPEIWRWDGSNFVVHLLQAGGGYLESPTSSLLMQEFQVAELTQFVELAWRSDFTATARAFRKWLQQYIADHGLTA